MFEKKNILFGSFLIAFGIYCYPTIQAAKNKNECIKFSTKGAMTKFNNDGIGETLLEETGLKIKELAKIEGYKNCLN